MKSFGPVEIHKNFKMGIEIDIAGKFIYDGMKDLEKINSYTYESEVFSFLYHTAVGIERLQKVLLVMLEEITKANIKDFEDSLHTHNHQQLYNRIKNKCNIKLSPRENSFLNVLNTFYINYRYDRYLLSDEYETEISLLNKFIVSHFNSDNIERHFITNHILNTPKLKDFFGRIIGSIARKYYSEIKEQAYKQNLYTYELRNDSPAQNIFLKNYRNDSLQEINEDEKIALKELIIYLINAQDRDSFMRYIKEIEPLDFDMELMNEYIETICKGFIPHNLVDEVIFLYSKLPSIKNRLSKIDLIGNKKVLFNYNHEIE